MCSASIPPKDDVGTFRQRGQTVRAVIVIAIDGCRGIKQKEVVISLQIAIESRTFFS